MILSYLKTAFRHLLRAKGYAIINVVGLGVGMAVCILILSHIRFELGFDSFWDDADRIYRVTSLQLEDGVERRQARAPARFVEVLEARVPGIARVARVQGLNESVVSVIGEQYLETGGLQAGPEFLHLMGIDLTAGSVANSLIEPYTVILSASLADKYFGDGEGNPPAFDREILIDGDSYRVTGIFSDLPVNSHLRATYITSLSTRRAKFGDETIDEIELNWKAGATTYVKLESNAAPPAVLERANALLNGLMADEEVNIELGLQHLPEIHMTSTTLSALLPGERPGNGAQLNLLIAIGAFILMIACVNFVNLATARASTRMKEIGVRKASGALRRQLVAQFMCETFVVVAIAFGVSLLALELAGPLFESVLSNTIDSRPVQPARLGSPGMIGLLAGVLLGTGVLAGLYPSIVLSRFHPVTVLKGGRWTNEGARLRNVLVTFQLVVSIVLLTGMLIVSDQLAFVEQKDLGYDTEHVLLIMARDHESFPEQYVSFRSDVESIASVAGVTSSTSYGALGTMPAFGTEPADQQLDFEWIGVDTDFVRTAGLSLIAGRDFSDTASAPGFLVNESAAEMLGWSPEEAIGREITFNRRQGPIIGVVADFHQSSLHAPIEPVILYRIGAQARPFVLVRTEGGDPLRAVAEIERIWDRYQPHMPFEVTFMDERVAELYAADRRFRRLFELSSAIALILAVMGLFGLSSFSVTRRTREIGIRKTLGATSLQILGLLSGHYIRLVALALLVGAPIGWYWLQEWLSRFAYRVEVDWTIFALAGGVLLLVTLAAVSWHAVWASMANPARSLRTD